MQFFLNTVYSSCICGAILSKSSTDELHSSCTVSDQISSVGNDLNQTIYKSQFKSLCVCDDFDLGQSAEGDL